MTKRTVSVTGAMALVVIAVLFIAANVRFEHTIISVPAASSGLDGAAAAPRNLTELVDYSDAIVSGVAISREYSGEYRGYDDNGDIMWASTPEAISTGVPKGDLKFPLSRITLHVNSVYLGADKIDPGDNISLYQIGKVDEHNPIFATPGSKLTCTAEEIATGTSLTKLGQEYLFFLAETPDHLGYGLMFGGLSRFDMSGDEVLVTTCSRFVETVTRNTRPQDFLDELNDIIAARATPTPEQSAGIHMSPTWRYAVGRRPPAR